MQHFPFVVSKNEIGPFDNVEVQFDPAIHHLTFDIVPTKMVREALKKVKVINNGAKGEVSRIGFVADARVSRWWSAWFTGVYRNAISEEVRATGKEDRITLSFVVERDGSLSNIEILRSKGDKQLEDEAIRIIWKMPKWIPGKQRGKVVKVKYTVPITFRK